MPKFSQVFGTVREPHWMPTLLPRESTDMNEATQGGVARRQGWGKCRWGLSPWLSQWPVHPDRWKRYNSFSFPW